MSLKIGALFAGYGGLDLAVEDVFDAVTAWVSEIEPAPSRILAKRFPHAPNYGDVTKIDWAAVEPVDIITGGSPCQDLSHAGKRAGMKAGTRSGLWASMCDAIETIRPRYVVWENVRGALSASADSAVEPCPICVGDGRGVTLRALGRVLGDLAELGYDACWTGLRAADVGAPHGRFRVFVLAWDAAANPDGAARGERWLAAPGQTDRGRTLSDAGRPGGMAAGAEVALLPTPAVNDMGRAYTPETWDAWTARMKDEHGNGNGHGKSLEIEAMRMLPTPRATDGTKGGPNQRGSSGDLMLPSAVQLLPTPRATRGGSGTETMYGLGAERSDEHRAQGQVLLPTPTAMDSKASGGNPHTTGTHGLTLTDATVRGHGLMPTPSVADVEGGRKSRSGERSGELLLNGLAAEQRFGDYAPAIARWEAVLGRPAPDPTEQDWERWEKAKRRRLNSKLPVGMRGSIRFILDGPPHRLSPRFVEWMMGLPDGWVTDTDTTRNEQLKALGNGVVPQQAAEALRRMLAMREAYAGIGVAA